MKLIYSEVPYIRQFGSRYEINSPRNGELMELFHETCEKAGIVHDIREVFRYLHTYEEDEKFLQASFFD